MTKPKVSVYIATSIDGYIAREDHSLDWLERLPSESGEDYGFQDFIDSVDTLILGRKTYEVVSSFDGWPYYGKRVIVISQSLNNVREEAELYSGDIHTLLSKLHSEGADHIYVDGGVTISKFLEAGLVDQMTITVIPTLLGAGIRLFHNFNQELYCKLISTQPYSNGLVQLRYQFYK